VRRGAILARRRAVRRRGGATRAERERRGGGELTVDDRVAVGDDALGHVPGAHDLRIVGGGGDRGRDEAEADGDDVERLHVVPKKGCGSGARGRGW